MPMLKKQFEALLINIEYDLYRSGSLDLSQEGLNDEQMTALAKAIGKNSYIKRVNLLGNKIGDKGLEALAGLQLQIITEKGTKVPSQAEKNLPGKPIETQPSPADLLEASDREMSEETASVDSNEFEALLEQIQNGSYQGECLALCDASLNNDDMLRLATVLQGNKKITGLVLDGNVIGDTGVRALAALPHLRYLGLAGNLVGPAGAQYLAESPLTGLDLTGNRCLGNEGAIALAKSKTLKALNISYCNIGDEGAIAILSNSVVETLDMSGNGINDNGVENIGDNVSLIKLNLSQNDIGPKGAKAIASHTRLEKVFLESNEIGDEGAEFLATSATISELDLTQNNVGEPGFLALCQNQMIQRLSLVSNDVCFSQNDPLPQATALRELYLGYNKIKDSPEEPLRSFASSFPKLTKLNVVNNRIGKVGALIFSQIKEKQPLLQNLDISGPDVPVELSFFGSPW